MNYRKTVSSWQMSTLFLAFMTGSAIVNIPAPLTGAAKNGAWISLIIANAFGLLLLTCILYLYRQYPGLTLIDYSRIALGKWLTAIIAVPFLVLLILMASYIVLDIGDFLGNTLMKGSPSYVFHSLTIMVAAMTARAGIEVMARMFLLLLYSMIFFGLAVILFALPYYHPEYLLPVMPDGIKPVLHGTYIALGFPYSELVLFGMLLPFTRQEQKKTLGKLMVGALLMNGFTLMTAIVCSIMAMGPLSGELKYSLFQIARLVNVQEFVERIESLIGISLIAGSYMKATIVLFALNLTLTHLFKLRDDRILIYPLALLTLLLTLVMFKDEAEFVEKVTVVWPLYNFVAGVIPLLLITFVTLFKAWYANSKKRLDAS